MMDPQLRGQLLQEWIVARIREQGPVTVARFMEWALYHPEYGYYMTGPDIGPRGDFTTSPEASPAFGRLMARHLTDVDALLGSPAHIGLVEFGPGKGTLAGDLLDALKSGHLSLYERLTYHLVEISPALRATQRDRLLPRHESVAWWSSDTAQLPEGLSGLIIANEFVDAFPVHVIQNVGGNLVEEYVGAGEANNLNIISGPLSDERLRRFVEPLALRPGEKVEVNLQMERWVGEVAHKVSRGVVTVIDYGDESPARYSPQRREGTLLAYYGGAVTDDIVARPGLQDLTALVDFTALQEAAIQAGLQKLATTRQASFLLGLGLGTDETAERAAGQDLAAVLQYRRGLQALISMEGLGRFHVLLLAKGVAKAEAERHLSGLKYASTL